MIWHAIALVALLVVHPLLPAEVRPYTYLASSVLAIPALGIALRRDPWAPWWILLGAMVSLSAGNTVAALAGVAGGPSGGPAVQILITLGHAGLLAAAVALVLRRGRFDIGGMLDVAVAAIALNGLVWTVLLYPRLQVMRTEPGEQLATLIGILALAGVLGALLRLWFAGGRVPALALLIASLTVALIGNIVMAYTAGRLTEGRPIGVDLSFMLAYGLVGLAVLHPSAGELVRPSSAPADRLSTARLIFLVLALLANPVAGGVREMLGQAVDGPLLAAGSLLVTSLAAVRVGRVAQQRERAEQRLRHQATHDLLTGLPNRAELLTRLAAALDRERAAGRPSVVLLFCDLNGFKRVNDRLGHEAGDQLLTGVAERLRAGLRPGDTVARYGGDEFLLLCEDDAPEATAARLAAHVERALTEPFVLAGEQVTIGSSVGAVVSAGDAGADELISRADQAMYVAKEAVQNGANSHRGAPRPARGR
jgi:diguanylate cyclase (GGDEF)-like protein